MDLRPRAEPPPSLTIGRLKTLWVDLELIRPFLLPRAQIPDSRQTVVSRGEGVVAKCEPDVVGCFTVVKRPWAEKNAPGAFGGAGLAVQQRGNLGIELEAKPYRLPRDPGAVWIPARFIPGITDNMIDAIAQGGKLYATVDDDGINVTPRRATHTEATLFVEASYMVSKFHEMVNPINAFIAPEAQQPRLPWYMHEDRRVVSPIVVRRLLLEERVRGVLPNMYKVADDTKACNGVFSTSFAKVVRGQFVTLHKKNAESVPVVSLEDVLAHPELAAFADLAGPGLPELPIVVSNHPPNTGSKGGNAGSQKGDVTVSVKSTLTKRLKGREQGTRSILEETADYVSGASRFGSYLLNLHFMRLLEEGSGVLSDEICDFDDTFIINAMDFSRADDPPPKADPDLRTTFDAYLPDLVALQGPTIYGLSNAIKKDAKGYLTSTMNSIHQHGAKRLAGLVKAALICERIYAKGRVRPIVRAVESGIDFPGSSALPESVKLLVAKYRKLYVAKKLDGKFGFAINDAKATAARQYKFRRVLEIYWEIENDMDDLAGRAAAGGWTVTMASEEHTEGGDEFAPRADNDDEEVFEVTDEASSSTTPALRACNARKKRWKRSPHGLLSVNKLPRRYVRLDQECWRRYLHRRFLDLELDVGDDLMSMFVTDGGFRVDVKKLRSRRKGYRLATTFSTDGTGLVTSYANASKTRTSGSLQAGYVPNARDRVIGVDPGRVNIMTCCVTMERDVDLPHDEVGTGREAAEFKTFTRDQYYADSGIDAVAARNERRKLERSREAHEALSQTRRKTVKTHEFLEYVRCLGAFRSDFHATYNSRSALGDKFSLYEGKLRTKDAFISSFGSHKDVAGAGRLVVAMGDASFDATGRGERAVPTTALQKRLVTAYKDSFITVPVDENNTTKACSQCHEITSECHRRKLVDGVEKWVKDRDVRRCNSPQCLESPHPCVAGPRLLAGLREWEDGVPGVYIDRDYNPSLSMARLCGLEKHERPEIFQRVDRRVHHNVPPG